MAPNRTQSKLDFIKSDLRIMAEAIKERRITIYPVEPETLNKDDRYDEIRDAWVRLMEVIHV